MPQTSKQEFTGHNGANLAARLDLPDGPVKAWALFAHCFTCSKDLNATREISAGLARVGVAVLRFDFTGLGGSDGDFASTNFSSNVQDLMLAAEFLSTHHQAPSLLIGHSLGGAAVLLAAGQIPSVKAVVTIGAPAEANHVVKNFQANLDEIKTTGKAQVSLAGRPFTIERQFLDDLEAARVTEGLKSSRFALLVMHSPTDQTVGIENATEIFSAARHPKSFVSLDGADHLLSSKTDAQFAATVIGAWSSRYLPSDHEISDNEGIKAEVVVSETGGGKFQNIAHAGKHQLLADEPTKVGGLDSGPSPYDYLAVALGACTSMTIRMYADFKKLDLGKVSVGVDHNKVHADDCHACAEELRDKGGKVDVFTRTIRIDGAVTSEVEAKLLEIADKCPVHRTLEKGAHVETVLNR